MPILLLLGIIQKVSRIFIIIVHGSKNYQRASSKLNISTAVPYILPVQYHLKTHRDASTPTHSPSFSQNRFSPGQWHHIDLLPTASASCSALLMDAPRRGGRKTRRRGGGGQLHAPGSPAPRSPYSGTRPHKLSGRLVMNFAEYEEFPRAH